MMSRRDESLFSFPPIDTSLESDEHWLARASDGPHTGNVYCQLIDAIAELAPQAPADRLADLREAGRLLARSVVRIDQIVDGDADSDTQANEALTAQICLLQALGVLHRMFPPERRFWAELARLMRIYSSGSLHEHEFRTRKRPWSTLDPIEAVRLTLQKNALAQAAIFGICELRGDYATAEPLVAAVKDFTVAAQCIDDANDWRHDYRSRTPSLVTAHLGAFLDSADTALAMKHATAAVLTRGLLHAVLERGHAHVRRASSALVLADSPSWRLLTGSLEMAYRRVLELWSDDAPIAVTGPS